MEEIKKVKENKEQYQQLFFATGNFYYFLIAQELNKIAELKLQNELNNQDTLGL